MTWRGGRGAPLALAALWAAAGGLAACRTTGPAPPAPDADGTAAEARELAIGDSQADELRCESESGPDCVDWYRFAAIAPGLLRLSVGPAAAELAEGELEPEEEPPPFLLEVADEAGALVGRAAAGADAGAASLRFEVAEPQAYLAAVSVPAGAGRHAYRLELTAEPPAVLAPAPVPAARFMVLAVEGASGPQPTLLIDGGRQQGLRPGLAGRLVEGERTLGRIVVAEVYEEGARVRVEGSLEGSVGPDTVAEIELPAPAP